MKKYLEISACSSPFLRIAFIFITLNATIICANAETLTEQPDKQFQPDSINISYFKGGLTDTTKIMVSPMEWNVDDWGKVALVLGATAAVYTLDSDIKGVAGRNQSSIGDNLATIGNSFGNPLYTVPPLGVLYLYGHYYEDPKARQTSLLAVESLAISGAFAWGLKLVAERPRPFTGESHTVWYGPGVSDKNPSFPSGHTTAAFSIATVVAEEYKNNPVIPPVMYGLAILTGLSRIYDDKHWGSDVLFGAAIGYFTGKAVVNYHDVAAKSGVRIMPAVSQNGVGIMAEFKFN